jgi:hypothetical protein
MELHHSALRKKLMVAVFRVRDMKISVYVKLLGLNQMLKHCHIAECENAYTDLYWTGSDKPLMLQNVTDSVFNSYSG